MVIPEYKIELLNKSKKVINTIENIDKINEVEKTLDYKEKVGTSKPAVKVNQKKIKKIKSIKDKKIKLRTLWVRRKKKVKSSL